ncbi:BZ3500_MvSof-1268-A1-R1_Chr1-3g01617 [Microbotryum saponariae]|uniref:BZ3500_MvSof-1268-A1-R1_Chr1-3g01617 protein n=1 Tax=Microbotryum saponariae TaxID=289078 RepID=A0A2X0L5V7_9BASI|nr:BZ3500_MvSof-1268-A1-R1_Chr1-3g01617 [Microbotryum saponariae]SCZ94151.1 BZ3501_MvSof-1269-A2-R1_Chr1-3g01218 [Microbotryum saponariae]
MLYVASIQRATAQLDAIKADWIQTNVDCLLVSKLNRIQVSKIDLDGTDSDGVLHSSFDVQLDATIAAIATVKLAIDKPSSLIVLTTSHQLFTLEYASKTPQHPVTTSSVSIQERFATRAELQRIVVDPDRRLVLVHAYNGQLRVIPLMSAGGKSTSGTTKNRRSSKVGFPDAPLTADLALDLSRSYNLRLDALNVRSIVMLPSAMNSISSPNIVVLHSDAHGQQTVASFQVDLEEKELEPGPETEVEDAGAETLIPHGHHGVLVVGEQSIEWVPQVPLDVRGKGKAKEVGSSPKRIIKCALPVGNVKAWTLLPGQQGQYLLGDIYGKLLRLDVRGDSAGRVQSLLTHDLGDPDVPLPKASSPTALVCLADEILYLASRFGDSQLIRLLPSSPNDELELVASYPSLAPITDSCVVRGQSGASSHLVTCSGAYKGGSLRVVRQGAGVVEMAGLALENVQRMWAVKNDASAYGGLLVMSLFNETQILDPDQSRTGDGDEGIAEVQIPGIRSDVQTLLAHTSGNHLVQVTASEVVSVSAEVTSAAPTKVEWRPAHGLQITLAEADGNHVLLALQGGEIELLDVGEGKVSHVASLKLASDVAAISLARLGTRSVAVVALWSSNLVQLIDLPTMAEMSSHMMAGGYLVRSLLLATFADSVAHLFVGLGDGSLVSFIINSADATFDVESQKSARLGTKPVTMTQIIGDDAATTSVLVSSDRVTAISRQSDRLSYSSVNLKGITAMVQLHSSLYPGAIAFASPSEVRLGRIESVQHVDIRPISLEEDEPRKIVHSVRARSFGVACLRRDVDRVTGRQTSSSSFKVLHDETFEVLASISLHPDEEAQSLAVLDDGENDRTCFILGTALIRAAEAEPSSGRILLISRDAATDSGYSIAAEVSVSGSTYSLAAVDSLTFVAAINSSVTVYGVGQDWQAIQPIATWGGAYVAFSLVSLADDQILVGDALRSLTLLQLERKSQNGSAGSSRLVEVARDYSPHYVTAFAPVSPTSKEFVGAESDLNLFTVAKDQTHNSRTGQAEVELVDQGRFHLGELVTSFNSGALVHQFDEALAGVATPRLVFTTSAGSVGAILDIGTETSKVLSELERNMRRVMDSVGELRQEESVHSSMLESTRAASADVSLLEPRSWRAFRSERQVATSAGFIDGDFIERFLTVSTSQVERIMAGGSEHERITMTSDELMRIVEGMSRLH